MARTPALPPGWEGRFGSASRADDDRTEFFGATGTFTGRNLAPAHKAQAAGGSFQTNILAWNGTEDADMDGDVDTTYLSDDL